MVYGVKLVYPWSLYESSFNPLLHNSALLTPLKYHVSGNIMENEVFALLEQMLHFP